jgi:hypothetical protein
MLSLTGGLGEGAEEAVTAAAGFMAAEAFPRGHFFENFCCASYSAIKSISTSHWTRPNRPGFPILKRL